MKNQEMKWLKIEKTSCGAKTREELIALCVEAEIELTASPKIFVAINENNEIDCYAIEDANDFVFWMDRFFTPDNREELIELLEVEK